MTERERLMALFDEWGISQYIPYHTERAMLAEYLLSGGVIVPPCKVGDKLFFIYTELNEICPAKVIGIFRNYYTPSTPLWVKLEYESVLIGRYEVNVAADVFSLVCRYTREEAEKALAEMAITDKPKNITDK